MPSHIIKRSSNIRAQIKETLLNPEAHGIELFNRFAVLANHVSNREPRCTIDDLPAEIWYTIFDWAKAPQPKFDIYNSHRAGKPHYKFDTNEEYPLFKTLRQVSKKLHTLTSPLLFKSYTLHYHPQSWASLNNISKSPMAPLVQTIRLSTVHMLQDFPTQEEWIEAIFAQWGEYATPWTQRPKGGPYAQKWDNEYGSWESGWPRYQEWKKAEDTMSRHYEFAIAPVLGLQFLTNLSCVETVDQLGVIKRTGSYEEAGEFPEYELSVREFETLVPNYGLLDFEFETNERHFDLFGLRDLRAGACVTELVLRNPKELIGGKDNVRFNALRHLQLNLGHCEVHRLTAWHSSQGLSEWVFHLPLLETFIIKDQQMPDSTEVDVFALLFGVHWPNLRSLQVYSCCVKYTTLMDFVNGHWDSLKGVRVELPRGIGREEWKRLRREIGDRATVEWDMMCDLTRETWESERERLPAEDQGSHAEGEDWDEEGEESQVDDEGSQAEHYGSQAEEESQDDNGGW